MVDVRRNFPKDESGVPDLSEWARHVEVSDEGRERLLEVIGRLTDPDAIAFSAEMAELLSDLRLDDSSLVAGVALFLILTGRMTAEDLRSPEDAALAASVMRMASADGVAFTNEPFLVS